MAVVLLNRDGLALVEDPAACNGCGPCNINRPIEAPCDDNATASVGAQTVTLDFGLLPSQWLLAAGGEQQQQAKGLRSCEVFDVFATPREGATLGRMSSFAPHLPPHGSRFVLLRGCTSAITAADTAGAPSTASVVEA